MSNAKLEKMFLAMASELETDKTGLSDSISRAESYFVSIGEKCFNMVACRNDTSCVNDTFAFFKSLPAPYADIFSARFEKMVEIFSSEWSDDSLIVDKTATIKKGFLLEDGGVIFSKENLKKGTSFVEVYACPNHNSFKALWDKRKAGFVDGLDSNMKRTKPIEQKEKKENALDNRAQSFKKLDKLYLASGDTELKKAIRFVYGQFGMTCPIPKGK